MQEKGSRGAEGKVTTLLATSSQNGRMADGFRPKRLSFKVMEWRGSLWERLMLSF